MRYNLGYVDKYPIEAAGTPIENAPMYRATFKRPVDPIRLEAAARNALTAFPLFATRVEFDREYYLRTNEEPLVILNVTEKERPKTFGKNTNGYPWRLIYDGRTVCFEWLHGVSDGMGALSFFKQILLCYFGFEPQTRSMNFLVAPGLEPFIDRKEKGEDFSVDPGGFRTRAFPTKYKDYRTDCHCLYTDTAEVLRLARTAHSSVTPILVILFSQAIRMHLPKKLKNRNVACNFVFDLRRILRYETMHNCVDLKRITYTDEYDKMSFSAVASRYKEILDHARLTPNIVRSLTERIRLFRSYHIFPNRKWIKFCVNIVGTAFKNTDCNIGITYPGKVDFPPEVSDNLENFDFLLWHDFGQCVLAAVDFNGRFNLNIAENFVEKGVVEDFIALSRNLGIHWKEVENSVFEQSHFEE
ncbi:MAG: hypothetical protein MJ082_00780 [Clostridia bacterium]|nr:hypothetical protein [Clostridia bacterium]